MRLGWIKQGFHIRFVNVKQSSDATVRSLATDLIRILLLDVTMLTSCGINLELVLLYIRPALASQCGLQGYSAHCRTRTQLLRHYSVPRSIPHQHPVPLKWR